MAVTMSNAAGAVPTNTAPALTAAEQAQIDAIQGRVATEYGGNASSTSPTSSAVSDLQATSQQQLADMAAIASIQMEYALKQNLIQAIEKMVTNTAKFIKNSTQDATG